MRTLWKTVAAAFAFAALAGAAAPAVAQDYDQDYGYAGQAPPDCAPDRNYDPDSAPPPGCESSAYCDDYGCPEDYYDLPVYYGPVFYDDAWYQGPLFYRSWYGQREYWLHGGWHTDLWRGPRPSWWDASRYHFEPALGRNYDRSPGWRGHGYNYDSNRNWNRGNSGDGWRYGGALDRRQGFRNDAQQGVPQNSTNRAFATNGDAAFAGRNPARLHNGALDNGVLQGADRRARWMNRDPAAVSGLRAREQSVPQPGNSGGARGGDHGGGRGGDRGNR